MQNDAVIACRKAGDIDKERDIVSKGRKRKGSERIFTVSFTGDITVRLSEDEVLEFGLYSPGELRKTVPEILSRIIYARIRDGILNFVLYKMRTEKQVRDRAFADRRTNGEEDVWDLFYSEAVDRLTEYLKEQKYIDDAFYAEKYVKSRKERNVSDSVIRRELRECGISDELISQFSEEDGNGDHDRAYAVLVKRMKGRSPEGTRMEEKERLSACRFLAGKGFSPDVVLKTVRKYEEQED